MSLTRAIKQRQTTAPVSLDGKLLTAGQAGYDHARRAWNLAVSQQPAAVVTARSVDDVVPTVELASDEGLRVAAQGTGHGAAALGSLDDTILVRTNGLRAVRIDREARIARIEAGVVWHEAVEAAGLHGLAPLAGSSPDVGVTGYTLGGGLSWLARKYGLAANSGVAIELVTADGRIVRTDHDHEPDLFWGVRGGGGSFGVVTAIELRLFPITDVSAGILWWPIERGVEVLQTWRELTSVGLPDDLTTVGRYLRLPELPEIPEPVRGRSFVVVEAFHLGDQADADELLAPLRALGPENDTLDTVPVQALGHLHMDPEHPVPAVGDGVIMAELPQQAIDELVRVAGTDVQSPLLAVELRQLGGELGRTRPGNGALASIEEPYALFAVGIAPTGQAASAIRSYIGHLTRRWHRGFRRRCT